MHLSVENQNNHNSLHQDAGGRRELMRPWLERLIDSGSIDGLRWVNLEHTDFQMPWPHGSRQGFDPMLHGCVYKAYAEHTGRLKPGEKYDHKRSKANFRCALNSLRDVIEVKAKSNPKGHNAYKVFRFLPHKMSRADRRRSGQQLDGLYRRYIQNENSQETKKKLRHKICRRQINPKTAAELCLLQQATGGYHQRVATQPVTIATTTISTLLPAGAVDADSDDMFSLSSSSSGGSSPLHFPGYHSQTDSPSSAVSSLSDHSYIASSAFEPFTHSLGASSSSDGKPEVTDSVFVTSQALESITVPADLIPTPVTELCDMKEDRRGGVTSAALKDDVPLMSAITDVTQQRLVAVPSNFNYTQLLGAAVELASSENGMDTSSCTPLMQQLGLTIDNGLTVADCFDSNVDFAASFSSSGSSSGSDDDVTVFDSNNQAGCAIDVTSPVDSQLPLFPDVGISSSSQSGGSDSHTETTMTYSSELLFSKM